MTAEKTVGFIKLTVEEEHTTKLSSIALLPSYENRGIGRQAMTLIERIVQTDTIRLNTILQEPKLVHFYHSLGYSANRHVSKPLFSNLLCLLYEKNCCELKKPSRLSSAEMVFSIKLPSFTAIIFIGPARCHRIFYAIANLFHIH